MLLQPGEEKVGRKEFQPHGGQFDGKRQTIQSLADGLDCFNVGGVEREGGLNGLRSLSKRG